MILGDIFYGDDTPQRGVAQLSQEGQDVINSAQKEALSPISDKYDQINQDMDIGNKTFGLIGGSDAIKQKYQGLLGNELQSESVGLRLNARHTQLQNIERAQSALLARTRVQNDIFARNMQNQQMMEAARAQAIGSILGIGGAVAGMYYGNKDSKPEPKGHVGFGGTENEAGRNRSLNYNEKLMGIGEGEGAASIGGGF